MSAVWARYTRGGERGGRGGRGVTTQVVAVAATQVVEAATGAELSLYLRGLCSRSARPHLTLDDVGRTSPAAQQSVQTRPAIPRASALLTAACRTAGAAARELGVWRAQQIIARIYGLVSDV